ncbi:hypothetical protein RND71_029110 [Anisodus tanguticus]|uniref:DUF1985 domain-containing protein n=1 Tax=Anisodus tanguticus TaxID=243964 RepID=A0AAE1RFC9_9SOLA|nr:hypothetical protein RND71_029110 [Anisodus tanguticus]
MYASTTFGKITGRGVKVDISTSSYFPSTIYVGDEDDNDFESPAPTNCCQQVSTRITRSQTKKVDKLVKNIKTRAEKCGRPEKAKVSLKLADEDEDDSSKSGKKKRKVENVAEDSYFAITKEERISTRLKFKERKSHLKVGDFYIHPNEHFRTRLSCHTETGIVSILSECLNDTQLQVVPSARRELWIKFNGCVLSFGIGEFDVITGLKCVEDDAIVYDKPSENMLMKAYFQGNKSVTRQQLLDRFKEKKWESDGDAFKMTLMVFIQHFLFSDTNDHCITKANFDIIESVDKHLVVRVDNNVPRILNWKLSDSPTYAGLTNGMIMPSLDKMKHCNICPTTEEKTKLKIAAFFKDVDANYVSSRGFQNEDYNISPPPHLWTMEQQPKHPHSQNTEQQLILRCDLSGSKDDLKAEVQQLRNEVSTLLLLDLFVGCDAHDDGKSGLENENFHNYDFPLPRASA